MKLLFAFFVHPAIAQQAAFHHQIVVAHKATFAAGVHLHPVVGRNFGRIARTVFLLLQTFFKLGEIHRHALLFEHKFGKVYRETVGVVECKRIFAANLGLLVGASFFRNLVEQFNAGFQGFEKSIFFFFHHLFDERLLGAQFGKGVAHAVGKALHQLVHKRFFEVEKGIAVAHGAAQNAANYIARLVVRRQLPVGNGKRHRADMVGHHAHRNIGLFVLTVGFARHLGDGLNEGLKHVGVVVGAFALQNHAQAFKAHARIYVLARQFFQVAVGLAVKLHKDEVPNFDDLRVVVVHQFTTAHRRLFFGRANVGMNFRAGTARPRLAHLPKVVFLVTKQNAIFRHMFAPKVVGFHIFGRAVFLVAAKNRNVEAIGIYLNRLGEKLPRKRNGLFFEIIAKRPVAQHLEHGVVIGVVAHLFEVVVLAAHAQTLLTIGHPRPTARHITKKNIFELIHPRVGEHQSRVVLDDHRRGGHYLMAFLLKEIQKGRSNLL